MPDCNSDAELANIVAECAAKKRAGGVRATIYATPAVNIAGMAIDPTSGALTTLTMKTGKKLIRLEGKKFKNTGSSTFAPAENGPDLVNQSARFVAYTLTQKQRTAVEALLKIDGLVLFVPLNANVVKVYGYSLPPNDGLTNGLKATDASESDGENLADETSWPITFTGQELNFPVLYESEDGFNAAVAELEALVTA